MKMSMPADVQIIIETIEKAGFEAYAVGGCVRDALLHRVPSDWDITTSAKPEDVKSLFSHTIDTGIQHGTVTVMLHQVGYEVTTYRIDGEYEDGRHPKEVSFTSNLKEDLRRRDFTINAMAYNDTVGLVDIFGGEADLKNGVIRAVGDPMERFSEDALRMLRAIRFSAQLGFYVEEDTKAAIGKLAPTIAKVSAERIRVEFEKLLLSDHPEEMRLCYETGLSAVFLPEWDAMVKTEQNSIYHYLSVAEHTLAVVKEVPKEKVLRLSAFFHDVAKPVCLTVGKDGKDHFYQHPEVGAELTKQILRRLKYDNDTIRKVCHLVRWHDTYPKLTETRVRRFLSDLGIAYYEALLYLQKADVKAHAKDAYEERRQYLVEYQKICENIIERGDCLSIKELAVDGKDLIQEGVPQGKELGKYLEALLKLVLSNPEKNTKDCLLMEIRKMRGN